MANRFDTLNHRLIRCRSCPRLIEHCREVAVTKRRAYLDETYWGRPVPNFGDPTAKILIVGLAPAAHGANRTGRMFTGDRSGDWLFRALHRAGLASGAAAKSKDDGLRLINCAITAVCHCAPPGNKPTTEEIESCSRWLRQTVELMQPAVFVVLGNVAFTAIRQLSLREGWLQRPVPRFRHGLRLSLSNGAHLLASYHPSQQNTFTGRLTESMLDEIMGLAATLATTRNRALKKVK